MISSYTQKAGRVSFNCTEGAFRCSVMAKHGWLPNG